MYRFELENGNIENTIKLTQLSSLNKYR